MKNIINAAFWLLVAAFCATAQILPSASKPATAAPAQPKDPFGRESPQSTVVNFLEAAHANDFAKAVRYLDLRNLPEDERISEGTELARQLEMILDDDAQFDVANLSHDPQGNLTDNLAPNLDRVASFKVDGRTLDLDVERVTLRSGVPIWLFSRDSIERIPEIAQTMNQSAIARHLPLPLVNWQFIGTPLWRWIGLVLLAIALAILSKWISEFALWLIKLGLKRAIPGWTPGVIENFIGPLRLLLSLSLFRAGEVWFAPSALARLYLDRLIALLFFAGVFWLCSVIIDAVIRRLRIRLENSHRAFSYSVLPLAGRAVKIVVLVLIIAAVLTAWGYNTTTLLAGLGIGGVAVALASQKTIENLFGSVAVITDRPVSVGDFCKFSGGMGTVEDIGLRSTRIRTLDRTVVTVPNGSFSTLTIENFDRKDKNLFHVTLNLKRETTPDQMRQVLDSITQLLKQDPKFEIGAVPVRFVGIGTYSLDIEIFIYVLTLDNDEFLKLQQNLLLAIMDAVHSAGTALAVPTQAIVNYSPDSTPPIPSANGSGSTQTAKSATQS